MYLPSSRATFRLRFCSADVILAVATPLVALSLRSVDLVSHGNWAVAGSYCLLSLVCSLVSFQGFGISDAIPRYLSAHDLLLAIKAALAAQLMAVIALFTITRLDGIPRSVPAIQALLLGVGLVAYRISGKLTARSRHIPGRPQTAGSENAILIGLNEWSVLVVKIARAQPLANWRIIALLDQDARWTGRSVDGVKVFGHPAQLELAIEEFATHGVHTHRVVVGGEPGDLAAPDLREIRRVCMRRQADLVFLPQLFPLFSADRANHIVDQSPARAPRGALLPMVPLPGYFKWKRVFDAAAAAFLILFLLPLLLFAALAVMVDVGTPILFWQQRLGRGGRELHVYKLRTLRPPFDSNGERIPEEQRLSRIGRQLRRVRVDELPQLLNVLVGDMSLIGPRPLLPQHQPPDVGVRLSVRPGITGWAQVNGGAKLSAIEKAALDVWYIRNTSLALDLRILGMTLLSLLRGDRRSETALAQARAPFSPPAPSDRSIPSLQPPAARFRINLPASRRGDARKPLTTEL